VTFASGKPEVTGVKIEWLEVAGVSMAKLEMGTTSTGFETTGAGPEDLITLAFEVAVLTASKNTTRLS
jgi:hypothetical protein